MRLARVAPKQKYSYEEIPKIYLYIHWHFIVVVGLGCRHSVCREADDVEEADGEGTTYCVVRF